MPYHTTKQLPSTVRKKYPDEKRRRQFMHVFNNVLSRHKDEGRAFASAYSVVNRTVSKKKHAKAAKRSRLSEEVLHRSHAVQVQIAKFLHEDIPMFHPPVLRSVQSLDRWIGQCRMSRVQTRPESGEELTEWMENAREFELGLAALPDVSSMLERVQSVEDFPLNVRPLALARLIRIGGGV